MMEKLFIVAVTTPGDYPNEAEVITSILANNRADMVHIRKPGWSRERTVELIEAIPSCLWKRLRIHDNFSLMKDYRLGGVHLNARNPQPPENAESVSCSMHSIEQLDQSENFDYVTLSPIFDSISKPGYKSAFNLENISRYIRGKKVVALGGVTPDKFPALRDVGFFGAAMLGHFWQQKT